MRLKTIILLLPVLFLNSPSKANIWPSLNFLFKRDSLQTQPQYTFFAARYHSGRVIQTNKFLKGINLRETPINSFQSLAISYGVQTAGQKEWHHVLNFPYYGFSFYNANFFNSQELGYPTALYGFLGIPLKRTEKVAFGYELGFGLTYNWKAYDPYRNPFNVAIGSHHTVYIDLSLFYSYNLTPRWQLKTGMSFTHFSNGATKKPNSGLNLFAPFAEVNYSLDDRPILIRKKIPTYNLNYELALQLGTGKKQEIYKNPDNQELKTVGSFSVVNISAAYLKQTTWKNKYGIGIDLTHDTQGNVKISYDETGLPIINKTNEFTDKLKMGIYGTYEFCIDRLSVASYLGFYALRKSYAGNPPMVYQKFGLKYHLKNDLYIGLLVRAHKFTVADVIEWNIGYRFKWS